MVKLTVGSDNPGIRTRIGRHGLAAGTTAPVVCNQITWQEQGRTAAEYSNPGTYRWTRADVQG
jgi:hypothetical protein